MSDVPTGTPSPSSTGLESNLAGLLAYLVMPLTGVLFFVIEKENRFVRFHAAQSIVVGAAAFVVSIALSIVGGILAVVPFIGWIFASLLSLVFGLAVFVLWVVLMVRAFRGEEWEVPIAGEYARRLVAQPARHV